MNLPEDVKDILSKTDHTLLAPGCTTEQIEKLCDEGMEFATASVCIPPAFVKHASLYIRERYERSSGYRVPICTVIGFPNGYSTIETKAFEANDAVRNGCDEIDMVINLCPVKADRFGDVLHEINVVGTACAGHRLKVIIETSLLTDYEKERLCEVVSTSYADFIKTSTGFNGGGATVHDVALLREHMKRGKLVKASGGIHTIEEARALIEAGADRIGASKLIADVKEKYGS